MKTRLPNQRWQIASAPTEQIAPLMQVTDLSPLLVQVLLNRDISTTEQAAIYVQPEKQELPTPLAEFPDLAKSVDLLKNAIASEEKIAICGDYDADGMTSTALLLRALKHLGADVNYAIPSRMKEGYGINIRIVEEFASSGIGLILTVDNGIAAYKPILRAVELGLSVIVTDHHDIPPQLPPADAILNPKLISESSPYRGLAGVGVAYILAVTTAQSMGLIKGLTNQLLELFTLGTIADLAPLVGVNRRWLKRGLRRLPQSEIPGVQELMKVAGVSDAKKALQPDDIGFRLGPRINAIGRLADPQIVIELLTTDNSGVALERAMQCEQINKQRQQLCEQIELEAVALIEAKESKSSYNWQQMRVLVIVQPDWHHGVIGIVASRLVERYGVPVFIGTYEDKKRQHIRGSARGIPEFDVFAALEFCRGLLSKFGGHKAAGGFTFPAANLTTFGQRLSQFAHQCLQPQHLKPLVIIDAQANFEQLTYEFYQQINGLHPWGIGNRAPVFWTPNVRVLEQKVVGKGHLQLHLSQVLESSTVKIKVIAWRWGEYFPLPSLLDVAYKLMINDWNGNTNIELELVGARIPNTGKVPQQTTFDYKGRTYQCRLNESGSELQISNPQGKLLAVTKGQRTGILRLGDSSTHVNVTEPHYYHLIKAASAALQLSQ